jgi:hypothetical protein
VRPRRPRLITSPLSTGLAVALSDANIQEVAAQAVIVAVVLLTSLGSGIALAVPSSRAVIAFPVQAVITVTDR